MCTFSVICESQNPFKKGWGWSCFQQRAETIFLDAIFHAAWQQTSKLGKEVFVFGTARERDALSYAKWKLMAPDTTPILIGYLSITPGLKMSGSLIKWNAYVYQLGISSRICACECVCVRGGVPALCNETDSHKLPESTWNISAPEFRLDACCILLISRQRSVWCCRIHSA